MIKIAEDYGIDFDKLNINLYEKYEKREGKGKNAPLSGEVGWREISHHGSWDSIVEKLEKLTLSSNNDSLKSMKEAVEEIKQLKAEIADLLNQNIVIDFK